MKNSKDFIVLTTSLWVSVGSQRKAEHIAHTKYVICIGLSTLIASVLVPSLSYHTKHAISETAVLFLANANPNVDHNDFSHLYTIT